MRIATTRTLIGLLIIAGAFFVLNQIALADFLYWRFWWYDVMMHFLGGVVNGGFAVWIAARFFPNMSRRQLFFVGLAAIAVIGVGWEVFEFFTGQYIDQANVAADTAQDLLMDTLGMIAVWLTLTSFGRGSLKLDQ